MKDLVKLEIKPARLHRSDVARLLGVSVSTVIRRCKSDPNFPKEIRDGAGRSAHVYFKTADIEAYIEKQCGDGETLAA